MIDPYTMERLNAERLNDIEREVLGLSFSRFARRNRRRALKAVALRLARLLITTGRRIHGAVEENECPALERSRIKMPTEG